MSAKEADFTSLLSLLNQQLELHHELLAIGEEQRQHIIANRTEELDSLVRQQAERLKKLTALEKKRLVVTGELHKDLQLAERTFTLSELIPYATTAQQRELTSLLNDFAPLLEKLKLSNETNKMLLQTNIELNELMLSLLADTADPLNNLYRGDGSEAAEGPAGPSLFDHQV